MEIAYSDRNIEEFMRIINLTVQEHPILIDKYLMGRELEVDGVFDGEDISSPASWSTWSGLASTLERPIAGLSPHQPGGEAP